MEPNYLFEYFKQLLFQNRGYIKVAVIIAIICIVIGAVVFLLKPEIIDYIMSIFEEKFGANRALDFSMVMDIFKNNLMACGVALFGGLLLGITPILVIGFNFFAIGIISAFFFTGIPVGLGQKLLFLLAALLPHGILELPVILLSSALGFRLGWRWLLKENKGRRGLVIKEDIILALKSAPILAAVLFFAAIVEVYGTGRLLEWLTPKIMGL